MQKPEKTTRGRLLVTAIAKKLNRSLKVSLRKYRGDKLRLSCLTRIQLQTEPVNPTPRLLYDFCWRGVFAELTKMPPERLWLIAEAGCADDHTFFSQGGKTSLLDVHGRSRGWLPFYASGGDILMKVACTAVIAEMWDLAIKHTIVDAGKEPQTATETIERARSL